DVCMAAYIQGKPLRDITVESAMSKRLITVHPLDSVNSAEATMRRNGVRRLLVVDEEGELVGLLSIDDIMRRARGAPVGPRDSSEASSDRAIAETANALARGRP